MNSKPLRHIAIIMDGNGRWAQVHRLTRIFGHRKGIDSVRNIVTACRELNLEALTLYAFSEENWKRPADEISTLMNILKEFLVSERELLRKHDIRLQAIGDLSRLPQDVYDTLAETMQLTETHKSMSLVLALSYGGRNEITRAVRKIADQVARGEIAPTSVSAETISAALDTAGLPDPDLLIRTSGEFRTSNFLPWQTIYSEIYVTPTLWPDFNVDELNCAIENFQGRERRFGMTSEQLSHTENRKWYHAL